MHEILGFDLGKSSLHLSWIQPGEPKRWSVTEIDYTSPGWHEQLLSQIDPAGATIVAEPTGYHLLSPIATLISWKRPTAQLWQTDGHTTRAYRDAYVSGAKNDRMDAIAMTLIARDIAAGQAPRHSRPYDHFQNSSLQRLRLEVNNHRRLIKERTRLLNRLSVLAFSLYPTLAQKRDVWLRAARELDAVTPTQIIEVSRNAKPPSYRQSGQGWSSLKRLAAMLPDDFPTDPAVERIICELLASLNPLDPAIDNAEQRISHLIEQPPFTEITKRWRTIPHASDIWIAALQVGTRGIANCITIDEARAMLGVNPMTSTSGDGDRTKQSRRGYRPARAALHLWTMGLVRPEAQPNPIRTYRETVQTERDFYAAKPLTESNPRT